MEGRCNDLISRFYSGSPAPLQSRDGILIVSTTQVYITYSCRKLSTHSVIGLYSQRAGIRTSRLLIVCRTSGWTTTAEALRWRDSDASLNLPSEVCCQPALLQKMNRWHNKSFGHRIIRWPCRTQAAVLTHHSMLAHVMVPDQDISWLAQALNMRQECAGN